MSMSPVSSFFLFFSSSFSCAAHSQWQYCTFCIWQFTKVMCYNRWCSRQCILCIGICACDPDSLAWMAALSRGRVHGLLFKISAVFHHTAALWYFADMIATAWSTSRTSLLAMLKPGEGPFNATNETQNYRTSGPRFREKKIIEHMLNLKKGSDVPGASCCLLWVLWRQW